MDESRILRNVRNRLDMAKSAEEDHDIDSSNAHLRMAIDDLAELVRLALNDPERRPPDCMIGVRAIALFGAAACERSRRSRSKYLKLVEEVLSKLDAMFGPEPRWNDNVLCLSA